MRILVVDDEADICEILQYNLTLAGYDVDIALSAEEALTRDLASYHLFLLDVMLGTMSGFDLAVQLRQSPATATTPIIFITALDHEDDIVHGLTIGADDYIAKPLSIREVKARVAAVLRRATPTDENDSGDTLRYLGLVLHLSDKTAIVDNTKLPLTRLEFELLATFLSHTNRLFDRATLMRRCWPAGTIVSDRTVDVSITRLRRKLGNYGAHLKARIGYGYVFET